MFTVFGMRRWKDQVLKDMRKVNLTEQDAGRSMEAEN